MLILSGIIIVWIHKEIIPQIVTLPKKPTHIRYSKEVDSIQRNIDSILLEIERDSLWIPPSMESYRNR